MICTPLGGVLAGLVAAELVPTHGWPRCSWWAAWRRWF
jgi:hypothetical protein